MDFLPKISKPTILIAEDDPDDRLLLEVALSEICESECVILFVKDGEELMDYLLHLNRYAEAAPPRPALILLDLNMPRKDGREALLEIRGAAGLREIPVVVWTTSGEEEDRRFCAESGASDYFTKPNTFLEISASLRIIIKTWLSFPPQWRTGTDAENRKKGEKERFDCE